MYERYLITGATGFLGRAVINELLLQNKSAQIYALVQKDDPFIRKLPYDVSVVFGDLCNDESLKRFFAHSGPNTCVIHCAGIVSVASNPHYRIYTVNAGGTINILRYCGEAKVRKLVYVSSVHAIPEKPRGVVITEDTSISPKLVCGHYAKTKAIATDLVYESSRRGLNASIVFPSGIIGPGDFGKGSMTSMLLSFLSGRLPVALLGGYDFVDVRDVACGIVDCANKGLPGEGYILSGHYVTIREILDIVKKERKLNAHPIYLPAKVAALIASRYEKHCVKHGLPLFFTPYAVSVLNSNGMFSHEKASELWGYEPRSVEKSLQDTLSWINAYKDELL